MILKVARLGHPALRTPTEPVSKDFLKRPETQRFIDDMVETMVEYEGVGLAANQVHVGKQIAVLECKGSKRSPNRPSFPLTVVVNAKFTFLSEEREDDWEGCLSVPDLRALVPRSLKVRVESLDRHGKTQHFEAEGFLARVLQHELDHLAGFVYLDRVKNTRTLAFTQELDRFGTIE